MLRIKVISSSSKGNCIALSDGASSLLLDAGLTFRKIQRSVDLAKVEAALITHHHMDHFKGAPEMARRGIPVYMTWEEWNTANVPEMEISTFFITSERRFETESWIIVPFSVSHDTPDPVGFLIESKRTGEKVVYAVDMPSIAYDFTGITHWLVEANYSVELLDSSPYEEFVKDRIKRSHMSVENLITFLKSSDLSRTEAIYLLHLSDANSDEMAFVELVEAATGIPVYAEGA